MKNKLNTLLILAALFASSYSCKQSFAKQTRSEPVSVIDDSLETIEESMNRDTFRYFKDSEGHIKKYGKNTLAEFSIAHDGKKEILSHPPLPENSKVVAQDTIDIGEAFAGAVFTDLSDIINQGHENATADVTVPAVIEQSVFKP